MSIPDKTKYTFIAVALAILATLPSKQAAALESVTLQLKWKHQFQFAGFYAAQKMGYFEEEGLDVTINAANMKQSTSEVVLSGNAEYGISDSSLVRSRLRGHPLVVVAAIFQHSPLVIVTPESSDIVSPLELKGKRVMYQRNIDDAVILGMLTELGLRDEDYTHVPHTFSDNELLSGTIDAMSAYITDQPYYLQEKGVPVRIFSPSSYGVDFYGDMIFVTEQYLKDNKDQVLAFKRASLRGWDYALRNQEEMVDWIIENHKPNKTRDHLLYEAKLTERMIQPELVELGYFSENRFFRIASTYKELGMAPIDSELSGISYVHYLGDEHDNQYLIKISMAVTFVVFLLLMILGLINKRLKRAVDERTTELKLANQSLEHYFDVLNQYVITCRASEGGIIEEVSQAFCDLTHYTKKELLGRSFKMLRHPDDLELVEMEESLRNGSVWVGDLQLIGKNGEKLWLHNKIEPNIADNKLCGFTAVSVDINDKKRIEELSITDSLTGLHNRRHFDEIIELELQRLKRTAQSVSLIMLDIDAFKAYNDRYGHVKGDECLQTVAHAIGRAVCRPADLSARFGGEEFVVLLPETDAKGAKAIAERIRNEIAELGIIHEGSNVSEHVTVSMGISSDGADTFATTVELIEQADKHLYTAKDQGRNCIVD